MPTTMLTPVEFSAARQAGATLCRKQLLPLGEIAYKGRRIAFTREYLAGLVTAFRDKAYDVVPFQFADSQNSHSNAPEQRRGTVKDLELTDDGLDIIVAAGPEAAKHLTEYPDLGVSARITEDYDRADGKFFPAAIQHVLGTLDPRITGMRPWQAVEAANDDGEVIDLTALEYAQDDPEQPVQPELPADPAPTMEDNQMALTADQEARLAKLLDLPDDRFDALLAEPETVTEDEAEAELTEAELDALLAEVETEITAETEPAAEPELVSAGAQLSNEAQAGIDLANARADEMSMQLARVRKQLDTAAYESERDALMRVHGIPPRITDLARTLLEGEGRTVDLANGKSADAGAIVRKVLAEIGKTVKMLDLSVELGSPLDGGADAERAAADQAVAERGELVSSVRRMTGI